MNEYLLRTDKFGKPAVASDNMALNILICRLIIMEPGSNRLHPEMGVGIRSRYRESDVEDLDNLEEEIKVQIENFLPGFSDIQITCESYEGDIRISFKLDDYTFQIDAGDIIENGIFGLTNNGSSNEEYQTPDDDGYDGWDDQIWDETPYSSGQAELPDI